VRCSGFLGGSPETSSLAILTITFLDANNRQLDELFLPTIGSRERDGKTGLFPVENSGVLPAGTAIIRVDLAFHKAQEGSPHPAYADNLELTLSEYANRPQRPTKLR
jgi:hypothetical protein